MPLYLDVLVVRATQVNTLKNSKIYKEFVKKGLFYQEFNSEEGDTLILTAPNRGTFFNLKELEELFDNEDFVYINTDDEGGIEIGGECLENPFNIRISGAVSFIINKQSEETIDELKAIYSPNVLEDKKLRELVDLSINQPDKYADKEELAYELLETYGLGNEDLESVFEEGSIQSFCKQVFLDTDFSKQPFFIATFVSDDLLSLSTRIEEFKEDLLVDHKDEDGNLLDDQDYASRTIAGISNEDLFNNVEEEVVSPQGDSLKGGFEIQVRFDSKLYRTYSECDWHEESDDS